MTKRKKAYLLLENGSVYEAYVFQDSEVKDICGEIVFTTSSVGYLETMTEPSYYGQIVVQTFPMTGNYGTIPEDLESKKAHLKAYIVREFCEHPSNFRNKYPIKKFLEDNNIIGLCGVDTRSITRQIRNDGAMKARILKSFNENEKEKLISEMKSFTLSDEVKAVSTKEMKTYNENGKYSIAVIDFGCKQSLIDEFVKQDCKVTLLPHNATAQQLKSLKPSGIVLSEGPGNPESNRAVIEEVTRIQKLNIPVFAIGLGHQILALANGAKTEKLKYGHRGSSQPIRDLDTGKVYVSAQNHGYIVSKDSLQSNMKLSFVNVNDNSCEGIIYTDMPCFSIQFAPVLCSGVKDSAMLIDKFIETVKEG